jgi:hypothetical protein
MLQYQGFHDETDIVCNGLYRVLSNNQFTGTLPNPPGPALQAV